MLKRFCTINLPTTSNYKNNMKIHLQDNFITYLVLPKSIVQCICFIKCVSLASTHRLTCSSPRARGVLFVLKGPYDPRIPPIVKFSQESESARLTKIILSKSTVKTLLTLVPSKSQTAILNIAYEVTVC